MFAAQVIDDTSETEQPDPDKIADDPGELSVDEPDQGTGDDQTDQPDPDAQSDGPEGSQYDGDDAPYEEYDGYAMPSENEDSEVEYIRASYELESGTSIQLPQYHDKIWDSRRNEIRTRYEIAPWMPHDALEFTPQYSITHIRGCSVCSTFKEHIVHASAHEGEDSFALKARDKYEQDLMLLGRSIAQLEHMSFTSEPPLHNTINASLERENHRLKQEMEALRRVSTRATIKCSELEETIELDQLDTDLRNGEVDLLLKQCTRIAHYCSKLELQLNGAQLKQCESDSDDDPEVHSFIDRLIAPLPDTFGDTYMRPIASKRSEELSGIGSDDLIGPRSETAEPIPSLEPGELIAAARVEDQPKDREFRSAQRRNYTIGERPRSSINDRRCMAALVKVNDLEAYALLDSGSTTISITHDFARVAKLNVTQLENPITLQLGTVGSRSIINFGSRASLELGTIKDDDVYLDVVNIDRYDMIIGTPFMRKHGLVLNFGSNTLLHKARPVPTLTAGQEDLMITRRRSARTQNPASGGVASRADH
jgi:hypothetical protein